MTVICHRRGRAWRIRDTHRPYTEDGPCAYGGWSCESYAHNRWFSIDSARTREDAQAWLRLASHAPV